MGDIFHRISASFLKITSLPVNPEVTIFTTVSAPTLKPCFLRSWKLSGHISISLRTNWFNSLQRNMLERAMHLMRGCLLLRDIPARSSLLRNRLLPSIPFIRDVKGITLSHSWGTRTSSLSMISIYVLRNSFL